MRQKIIVKGPVLSQSGYGEQARFALRALKSREDLFDIHISPTQWGKTGWISLDNEERGWIDSCIIKKNLHEASGGSYDVSLQVTIPNEFEPLAPINIGYTAGIETDRVSPSWVQYANQMNRIIVVSNHSKKGFVDAVIESDSNTVTCTTPIDVVNYPVRVHKKTPIKLDLEGDFNYLAVCQWGPRKNLESLIRWFVEENIDTEVGLVIKTNTQSNCRYDRKVTTDRLNSILSSYECRKCKVYLLHGDLSEGEMTALYTNPKIKCLVSTTHGEGYGLPLFEAAYNGLPVIAPGWSGQTDFLYIPDPKRPNKKKPMFASLNYEIEPVLPNAVWPGVIEEGSKWAYVEEANFKQRITEVRESYNVFKRRANKLKKYLVENFNEETIYKAFINSLGVEDPLISRIESLDNKKRETQKISNVKQRAKLLAETIRTDVKSQAERLQLLKDSFRGETCYILSCGPTLTDHNQDKIKKILSNNLVISVKQAFDLYGEYTDFHTYNCANYKNYDYSVYNPITIEASTSPRPLGNCDIKFFIRERDFNKSVSVTHNFDDWTYDAQTLLRPYGPGIMYESVFYLAQHLGVSEIITIGWDNKLLDSTAAKQHFYDKEGSNYKKEDFIHSNEVAQNPAAVQTLNHEWEVTTAAIEPFSQWLQSQGTTLKIISDINPAPASIEKVEV